MWVSVEKIPTTGPQGSKHVFVVIRSDVLRYYLITESSIWFHKECPTRFRSFFLQRLLQSFFLGTHLCVLCFRSKYIQALCKSLFIWVNFFAIIYRGMNSVIFIFISVARAVREHRCGTFGPSSRRQKIHTALTPSYRFCKKLFRFSSGLCFCISSPASSLESFLS